MTEAHATINREIAEGLGWKCIVDIVGYVDGYPPATTQTPDYLKPVPDYINSADASAELEDELHRRGWRYEIFTYGGSSEMLTWVWHPQCDGEDKVVPITTSASAARRLALATCAAKVLKRQEKSQ